MMERLAKWYLRRRGIIVLDRKFIGLAVGYCHAMRREDGSWIVRVMPSADDDALFVALNHSRMLKHSGGPLLSQGPHRESHSPH